MSEKFIPIPVTNEDVYKDRYGQSLNVGDPVAYAQIDGVIAGYNQLYFAVASMVTSYPNGVETKTPSVLSSWYSPSDLINTSKLLSPKQLLENETDYAKILDFSSSETKKSGRKYLVLLVGDYKKHSHHSVTNDIDSLQVVITSLPGGAQLDLDRFHEYLKNTYDARVISYLCTSADKFNGYYVRVHRNVHFWTVIKQISYYGSDPAGTDMGPTTVHVPLNQFLLPKRRLQELGLLEHLDTAMSVAEFNAIVQEDRAKWNYDK